MKGGTLGNESRIARIKRKDADAEWSVFVKKMVKIKVRLLNKDTTLPDQ